MNCVQYPVDIEAKRLERQMRKMYRGHSVQRRRMRTRESTAASEAVAIFANSCKNSQHTAKNIA